MVAECCFPNITLVKALCQYCTIMMEFTEHRPNVKSLTHYPKHFTFTLISAKLLFCGDTLFEISSLSVRYMANTILIFSIEFLFPEYGKFWLTLSKFKILSSWISLAQSLLTVFYHHNVKMCVFLSFYNWTCFNQKFFFKMKEAQKRRTLGHCVGETLPRRPNEQTNNSEKRSPCSLGHSCSKQIQSANEDGRTETSTVHPREPEGCPVQTKGHAAAATHSVPPLSRKSLSARFNQVFFFFSFWHSEWISACEALNNPALREMFCRNCMTRLPKGLPLDFLCPWVYFS